MMMTLTSAVDGIAEREFLGNPLWAWIVAAAVAPAVYVVLALALRVAKGRLHALRTRVDRLATRILDALGGSVRRLTLAALALLAAALALELGDKAAHAVRIALVAAAFLQACASLKAVIDVALVEFVRRRAGEGKDLSRETVAARLGVLRYVALGVVYSLLALTALHTLGVNVTALVAGLGIGGIAVALAVQNILGDLFASLSIVIDKPFEVGDSIVAGSESGTVETIGLKTTRVRAPTGEELIFTNGDLLKSRIRNFKRMKERRRTFTIGVTYQTSPELLREIPGLIRRAVEKQKGARFDRAHFTGFGASSLDFEAAFWVENPDMRTALDVQQAINLELFETFAARSIAFAYPTQTVYVEGSGAPAGARA